MWSACVLSGCAGYTVRPLYGNPETVQKMSAIAIKPVAGKYGVYLKNILETKLEAGSVIRYTLTPVMSIKDEVVAIMDSTESVRHRVQITISFSLQDIEGEQEPIQFISVGEMSYDTTHLPSMVMELQEQAYKNAIVSAVNTFITDLVLKVGEIQ